MIAVQGFAVQDFAIIHAAFWTLCEAAELLVPFVASVATNGSATCKRAVRSREPPSGTRQQAETAPKLQAPGPVALQVCKERSCCTRGHSGATSDGLSPETCRTEPGPEPSDVQIG